MKAILQWVLKTMMKDKTGVVQTLPNKDLVDFNVAMTVERLMRNGIDPNSLKNANQVENAINRIEAPRNVQQGIKSTKSAKVFNIKGEELDPKEPIIGGTQPGKSIDTDAFIRNAEAQELETKIKKKLEKGNKESIARIRARQKMIEEAIDNVSPGFSGDLRVDADLVAEEMATRMGKVYDDLPDLEGTRLYGEAYDALSKKRFESKLDPEDMATGGRAGFSKGSGLKTIFNFLNENNPLQAYKKYLKSVENRMKAGKELEVAGEVIPIAAGGALITNQMKKILKKMNEEQKKKIEEEAKEELKKDRIERANGGLTPSFEEYMRERRGMEQKRNLEQMYKEYLEDLRRKKVMEQKQMVADGGRIGFKDGMTRRTFLKLLGGMAAVPIVGKFFKLAKVGKTVTKVPMIKTDNVAGKPEWFDALVNKVIMEGDDVTKKFATGERQSIHQKTLDDGSVVRVTEDVDDGAVRVEYESDKNVFEDPVQLQYKKPLPDEGDPRPTAEFTTAESGPVGRQVGPDDYDIDVDEVGGTSIRDLDSDVSKLKEYATGKKPTMKELVQNIKRREKAAKITEGGDEMIDAVTRRQGDYVPEPDDFASGGIARLLGE
jgi:hypothetical protein